jgi:hypothetical protein
MYAFRGTAVSSFTESGGVNTGTDDSVECPSVTTSENGSMAVAFTAIDDDHSQTNFTGETGGNYTEAVAEYTSSLGLDGSIGLQTATMATAGTVSGGSFTIAAADAWVCRSFSLKVLAAPTVPDAPTLDSAAAGDGEVDLSWTAPADDGGAAITAYKVLRGTTPGGETLLDTLGVVTTYNDGSASNGTTYYYKVRAVNSVGDGALSNELSATPESTITADLTALGGYNTVPDGCSIAFVAGVGVGATGLALYRADDDEPTDEDFDHFVATLSGIQSGVPVAGESGDDGYASASVAAAATSWLVYVHEGGGRSSLATSADWGGSGDCPTLYPNTPVLTAEVVTDDVTLNWTESTFADERTGISYDILRDPTSPPTTVLASGIAASTITYDDTDLAAGGYYYRIRMTYQHPGHAVGTFNSNIVSVVVSEVGALVVNLGGVKAHRT